MESCVLIVDDERIQRRLVRLALAPAGVRVVEAATGEEALTLIRTERPRLILLDLGLPDRPGTEVGRGARELLGEEVRVLIRSGRPEQEVREAVEACGADGQVSKELLGEELLERVRELLES